MCTALLLVVGFVTAYVGVRHEYGAGLLFAVAINSCDLQPEHIRLGL
jgi:hypothetical protein